MVILFIAIGLKFLNQENTINLYFSCFSKFFKLTRLLFSFLFGFIYFSNLMKKIRLIFKTIGITLSSLIIVNTILIIPPLSIG